MIVGFFSRQGSRFDGKSFLKYCALCINNAQLCNLWSVETDQKFVEYFKNFLIKGDNRVKIYGERGYSGRSFEIEFQND